MLKNITNVQTFPSICAR